MIAAAPSASPSHVAEFELGPVDWGTYNAPVVSTWTVVRWEDSGLQVAEENRRKPGCTSLNSV